MNRLSRERKGVNSMEQQPTPKTQQTVRHQFDSFVKKALRGEVSTYRKEMARRAQLEVTFSDLSETELNALYTIDEYPSDHYAFRVLGYDVEVRSPHIGAALESLPPKKRDIILLAYFLDMTDTEIARCLNVVSSTIHYHRLHSLHLLHTLLTREDGTDEKQNGR